MKAALLTTTALARVPPQKPPPFAAFAEALALETADELVFLRTGARLDRRVIGQWGRNQGKTAAIAAAIERASGTNNAVKPWPTPRANTTRLARGATIFEVVS